MPLYRKKPIIIEAVQFKADKFDTLCDWCGGEPVNKGSKHPGINIRTLEGNMLATEGDFIIRGITGEFYPCKPSIFLNSYEHVPEGPPNE